MVFTVQDFIQIIQSVGFPIACAVAMFVLLNNEQKNHKAEEEELNKALTEMKLSFADALNNQQKEIILIYKTT